MRAATMAFVFASVVFAAVMSQKMGREIDTKTNKQDGGDIANPFFYL